MSELCSTARGGGGWAWLPPGAADPGSSGAGSSGVVVRGLERRRRESMPVRCYLWRTQLCWAATPPPPRSRTRLISKPGPRLAARHWRPGFLPVYLGDPSGWKPGTTMPDVLHDRDPGEVAGLREVLDAYLSSLTPPGLKRGGQAQPFCSSARGGVLYHQVGCVACHPAVRAGHCDLHSGGRRRGHGPAGRGLCAGENQAGLGSSRASGSEVHTLGLPRFLKILWRRDRLDGCPP